MYFGILLGLMYCCLQGGKFLAIRSIGDNIHSSMKNYYFGISSTVIQLIWVAFQYPEFFNPTLIGTESYPLNGDQLLWTFIAGVIGWASQESLTLALGSVKAGTVAGFQNIAILVGFLTDTFILKR